ERAACGRRGDTMPNILETLGELVGTNRKTRGAAERYSRTFFCRCGNHIFFHNSLCLGCRAPLGYLPYEARLVPLDPGPQPGTWDAARGRPLQKSCGNRETPARCNWPLADHACTPLSIPWRHDP